MENTMLTLISMLLSLVMILFLMQVFFFELSRNRAKQTNNSAFFMQLDKPYSYTRTGMIAFLCGLVYLFNGKNEVSGLTWFAYLFAFIALGVISDAIVQFLILRYGKIRCKKEIENTREILSELDALSVSREDDDRFELSFPSYDEISITKKYLKPTDHMAFLSIDKGEFVKKFKDYPALTYDVEPYAEISEVQGNLGDLPVRVTTLTPSNQMPFKDDRIDLVMNQYSNYDKNEVARVLRPGGYFIVNQNGTENLKEFLSLYMPLSLTGIWDVTSCQNTLSDAGFKIEESHEDFGFIRFRNLNQIRTYFKTAAPEVAGDVKKFVNFYTKAFNEIKENGFFKMTTYRFIVVARNK
ncbi:hypothetical protein [Eggerthia catenaformis]|uniref:hypothetical protein n=1 Tax=Eggerthia catenaformis TaxID=31973 RepID=UPI0028EDE861|nr:hypothetical protein [Eggerthia catenaformis]